MVVCDSGQDRDCEDTIVYVVYVESKYFLIQKTFIIQYISENNMAILVSLKYIVCFSIS